MKRSTQFKLFKATEKAYGGSLLMKRKGRLHGRPLSTRESMHLVLRSTLAKGEWSFRRPCHARKVDFILGRFAKRFGVTLISVANSGNHLHIHLRLGCRHTYRAFIRAVTAAIAMAVTGASRWKKLAIRFWDRRPFTRVVVGRKAFLLVEDYVRINDIEAELGMSRDEARSVVQRRRQWQRQPAPA